MLSIKLQVREQEPLAKPTGRNHSLLGHICAVTVSFNSNLEEKRTVLSARKDCKN